MESVYAYLYKKIIILQDIFNSLTVQGCIQKLLDWPSGVRTANGTALCN